RCLGHVHGVIAHDRADQPVLPRCKRPARGPIDHPRQRAMRQDVLQEYLESHPPSIEGGRAGRPYNVRPFRLPLDCRDRRACHHHRLHPLWRQPLLRGRADLRPQPRQPDRRGDPSGAGQPAPAAGHSARVWRGSSYRRGAGERAGADRAPRRRAAAGGLPGRRNLVCRVEVQERPPRAGATLDERHIERALDLCTGSGCIGIAMAEYNPDWRVDIVDISDEALSLARENIVFQHVEGRVEAIRSDLFAGVKGRRYDLIVSNPPYVTEDEYAALPGEYAHEPKLGLTSGADGLDLCLRMLDEAADQLTDDGLLIVEVGESEHALAALL